MRGAPRPGRPLASISLDLDNLWSYQMIHGDPGWDAYPTYLDRLAPVVNRWRARRGQALTIFIVGRDAARPENAEAIKSLCGEDVEVGNHSLSHEPWFHTYDRSRIEGEIHRAADHIEALTGQRPVGFRGPGFSLSAETVDVLAEGGYLYDASTFPTSLGPLARAWYFWSTRGMDEAEREKRSRLFGRLRDGLRPIRPYEWEGLTSGGRLMEIPVTTAPLLRFPIHMSYLGFLGGRAPGLAKAWLRGALAACRATGVEPSFLLHPLDFIGADVVKELSFFPGMDQPTERKLRLLDDMIDVLAEGFELTTLRAHAEAIRLRGPLARRTFDQVGPSTRPSAGGAL